MAERESFLGWIWWPRLRIVRFRPGFGYSYRGRRSAGGSGLESLLLRQALWNGLCDVTGRWRWKIKHEHLCLPGWKAEPLETDDWSISLDCGHVITRTYMHDPLRALPTDLDDEPQAYCPTHGFERVWFTSGVLDPHPWYPDAVGEPGYRIFGSTGADHAPARSSEWS